LHLGTLLAVLVYFRKSLFQIARAFICGILRPRCAWKEELDFRLGIVIGMASLPAGVIGWVFHDSIESFFGDPALVCVGLIGTGLVVLSTRWVNGGHVPEVGAWTGLAVGMAQAVAILPGVSRSGATISCARWLGICEEEAGRFSFLLSIPVIAGAGCLKLHGLLTTPNSGQSWIALGVGAAVALGSGLVALHCLLALVRRQQFWIFGPYCLLLGGVGVLLLRG
jgi:undecaprenyl-diphosphatase